MRDGLRQDGQGTNGTALRGFDMDVFTLDRVPVPAKETRSLLNTQSFAAFRGQWSTHSALRKDFAKIAEQVERTSSRACALELGLERLDSQSTVHAEGMALEPTTDCACQYGKQPGLRVQRASI